MLALIGLALNAATIATAVPAIQAQPADWDAYHRQEMAKREEVLQDETH